MSRIGKNPVSVPEGVSVKLDGSLFSAECSGKSMQHTVPDGIIVEIEESTVNIKRKEDTKELRTKQGLTRTLINNMVTGVKDGFTKKLEMVGRGKRAKVQGKSLILEIGFSHPVDFAIPEGIQINVDRNIIEVAGYDKQKVGEIAAEIRAIQPPEPYKGAGIRYQDEYVKKKAGKAAIGGGFTGGGK